MPLAYIIWVDQGAHPEHPIYYPPPGGGQPPTIWPNPPEGQAPIVSHPIAPGGPPPQIWPSPGVPTHPIYYPPYPSHPIYNPGGPPGSSPPGYWGGGMGPGVKPQPPGQGGQPPIMIWPNPPEGSVLPEHPIVLPPDLPPTMPPPDERPIEWKAAWSPQTGWVVIGVPSGAHPTPSA
jgi:hypothetical protein